MGLLTKVFINTSGNHIQHDIRSLEHKILTREITMEYGILILYNIFKVQDIIVTAALRVGNLHNYKDMSSKLLHYNNYFLLYVYCHYYFLLYCHYTVV